MQKFAPAPSQVYHSFVSLDGKPSSPTPYYAKTRTPPLTPPALAVTYFVTYWSFSFSSYTCLLLAVSKGRVCGVYLTLTPDLLVNILAAMFIDANSWKSSFVAYGICTCEIFVLFLQGLHSNDCVFSFLGPSVPITIQQYKGKLTQ